MPINIFLAPALSFSLLNSIPNYEQDQTSFFSYTEANTTQTSQKQNQTLEKNAEFKIKLEDKTFPFSKQDFVKKLNSNIEIGFSSIDDRYSVNFGLVGDKIVGIIGEGKNPDINPAQSPEQIKQVYSLLQKVILSNPVAADFNIRDPQIILSKDSKGKSVAIFEIHKKTPSDVFDRIRAKLQNI